MVSEARFLVRLDGVYAVRVKLNGDSFFGMLNIGSRPTIETQRITKNIEVHILDFDQKIYNQTITVSFVKRIRDEKVAFYFLERQHV